MREIEPGDKPVELAILVAGLVPALDGDYHAGRSGFLDRHAGCVMHADLLVAGLQVAVGPGPGGNHRPQAFLAQAPSPSPGGERGWGEGMAARCAGLASDLGVGQQHLAVQGIRNSATPVLISTALPVFLTFKCESWRWGFPLVGQVVRGSPIGRQVRDETDQHPLGGVVICGFVPFDHHVGLADHRLAVFVYNRQLGDIGQEPRRERHAGTDDGALAIHAAPLSDGQWQPELLRLEVRAGEILEHRVFW